MPPSTLSPTGGTSQKPSSAMVFLRAFSPPNAWKGHIFLHTNQSEDEIEPFQSTVAHLEDDSMCFGSVLFQGMQS